MIIQIIILLQDTNLLTSCSITERLKLWDRYSGPIDQDAIKIEFMRKAKRNYPFKYRVRFAGRNRVRVSLDIT